MENLKLTIENIKSIQHLEITLPLEKGLYAITGENGAGKSTVVACASSAFHVIWMKDHFGEPLESSSIKLEIGDASRLYYTTHNQKGKMVWRDHSHKKFNLKGFYEGSIIFGTRFSNTNLEALHAIRKIGSIRDSSPADNFVSENLGYVLHGDKQYYRNLSYFIPKFPDADNSENKGENSLSTHLFNTPVFFYEKNGYAITQFHMSTGESLLTSILYSLSLMLKDRAEIESPMLILLDEIELALHPASLVRLLSLLKNFANQYNCAIYFSTHSLELISTIEPSHIFFIKQYPDGKRGITNPCYPAYATRTLYDHNGYDRVFLVEDDLAKNIVQRIIQKERLLGTQLIHILPCGGFSNVIDLAFEVVDSNLFTKKASVSMILDADIKDKAKNYVASLSKNFNVPLNFLPIPSLEKYLREVLVDNVDTALFDTLNSYIFHKKPLDEIIKEYKDSEDYSNDGNCKKFFKRISKQLDETNSTREELITLIIDNLFTNQQSLISDITTFLKSQLA